MSSRDRDREKRREEKEGQRLKLTEEVDQLALEVDATIRNAGADALGMKYEEEKSVTMKALLHQYTQSKTLAEIDEDGEHPLFPQAHKRGGELRNPRARKAKDEGAADAAQGAAQSASRVLLDSLLRHLDNDRLPQIKEHFMIKGNALGADDFVTVLRGYIGHVGGIDERQVSAELKKLHARLAKGSAAAIEGDDAVEPEADAEGAEGGDAAEASEAVVTWSMFAKLLLDTGVVHDVVSSFNIVKVLSLIDLEKIAPLREEFMQRGNSLALEVFIIIMKGQFHYIFELTRLFDLQQEERHLIAQMVDLFEMIDINGNNSLSWEEFTAFLVDQGMAQDVPREFNIIRFTHSQVRDDTVHQSHCEKATYFPGYDKIAYVEQGSRVMKICNPDMTPYHELNDYTQSPLCAVYIERENVVVVASSDLTLSFYDAQNSLKLHRKIKTATAQLVMCWSEVAQVLYSADYEGRIFPWDVAKAMGPRGSNSYDPGEGDNYKEFIKQEIDQATGDSRRPHLRHLDTPDGASALEQGPRRSARGRGKSTTASSNRGETIVMALLELPVLGLMASCGVDKNVMLWDVLTGHCKGTLRGHEMGVSCMAFATSSKVLVTGGYDYNLMVWNPYVSKYIHTIHSHNANIVGLEVLGPTSNQILSADSEGVMKTWDLSTYQCVQTIVVADIICLRAFISIPAHKRIFAVDRRFIAYDYLNTGVADQTDEGPIIKAFYVPRLKAFISGCSSHLRIWDAVTGAIMCVIQHKEAEITDFCVDDRGRKVCIADHSGAIYVHNTATGCLIKKLTPHASEVSGMIYCPGDKNLITVSWDHSIVVHDESEQHPKVWRRATNCHKGDISCVAFSRHLGLIATGATDCVISIREYERLRTISSLVGHKSDITALAFIDVLALLVSADLGGNIAVWAVTRPVGPQHRHVDKVLTRFVNMQSLESSASVNCLDPVYEAAAKDSETFHLTAEKDSGRLVLYTGDEDGDVRSWDLSRLLSAAELEPCEPKKDWDPRKKDQIDCTHATEATARKAMALETPELPIQVHVPCMKQGVQWHAHNDSIRSIKAYASLNVVITAGYDSMVKIWTREGQMMTVLRAYGSIAWKFPVKSEALGIDEGVLDAVMHRVERAEQELDRRQKPRHGLEDRPRGSSTLGRLAKRGSPGDL